MKKLLILCFVGLSVFGCDKNKVSSPLELVKTTTIKDTYAFCMKVNGNKAYCDCESKDLEASFPWKDYMAAVDVLAGEQNHIQKVIDKHNGNRSKILSELNCDTCYFSIALAAVDVHPSQKCIDISERGKSKDSSK